jgi:hypothetical protein
MFEDVAPLLFADSFEKKMKGHLDALKCLRRNSGNTSREGHFSQVPILFPTTRKWRGKKPVGRAGSTPSNLQEEERRIRNSTLQRTSGNNVSKT